MIATHSRKEVYMPGPKNTSRRKGPNAGTTDAKARRRLQRRIDAFKEPGPAERQAGLWTHKPGSERK